MELARGLPSWIIAKYGISKEGWRVFRESKAKTSPKAITGTVKSLATKRRYRRSKRRRGPRAMTIPLPVIAGVACGLAGPVARILKGDFEGGLKELSANYTGYVPGSGFSFGALQVGLYPLIAGFAVHWLASKFGINRALGRAQLPLIRM